jgi:hypothetical protein
MARGREGGEFRLRVSDVVEVPLRGTILRLKVLDGQPAIGDVKPGRRLRLSGPSGEARTIRIEDHAVIGGRQTQERLDRLREVDVIVSFDDARGEGTPVREGWTATGPVTDK